jgi:peptidoglycan/LPS O-acetylase OafA/YrhL
VIGFRSRTAIPSNLPDWLDLARGLAAVEVVAFHSYQLMFQEQLPGAGYDSSIVFAYSSLWAISAHGVAAVMVFFVLSGYLVGGPALVRARNGGLSAIDYFSARASRLYVVLIPALAISFCAYVFARQLGGWQAFVASREYLYSASGLFSASVGPATAVCNGLFLQTIACATFAGNLALWSLSNEFWYYALAFALLSVRRKPSFALLVGAIFVLFVVAERSDPRGTHTGLKFFFYFIIWCGGALVYAVAAPAMVWIAGFLGSLGGIYILSVKGLLAPWAAYHLAIGLFTAAAIVSLEFTRATLPSFLRFTKEIAKFSFSLYAIHYPILVLLNVLASSDRTDFTLASFGLNAAFILCCVAISFVFYLLFESRTCAVRAWLRNIMGRGANAKYDVLQAATAVRVTRSSVGDDHGNAAAEHIDHSRGTSVSPPWLRRPLRKAVKLGE